MNGIIACLFGRVGQDAELRYTAQGTAFASVSVAVEDNKRAEDGPTEWARCTVWGELAEEMAPRLTKGTRAYFEGRARLKTWTKDGAERSGLELSCWTCQPIGQIGRRAPKPAAARDAPERRVPTGGGWLQAVDLAGGDRRHLV